MVCAQQTNRSFACSTGKINWAVNDHVRFPQLYRLFMDNFLCGGYPLLSSFISWTMWACPDPSFASRSSKNLHCSHENQQLGSLYQCGFSPTSSSSVSFQTLWLCTSLNQTYMWSGAINIYITVSLLGSRPALASYETLVINVKQN